MQNCRSRRDTGRPCSLLPGSTLLLPGPYTADPVDMIMLIMQDDPVRLRTLLPPHLHLLPFSKDRYLVVFSHFKGMTTTHHIGQNKDFEYRETAFFIPAWGRRPEGWGAFCPELFPDSYLAIVLGRELYGFPKRDGATYMPKNDDKAQLIIENKVQMEASWKDKHSISAKAFTQACTTAMLGDARWVNLLGQMAGDTFEFLLKQHWEELIPRVPVLVRKQEADVAFRDETQPVLKQDRLRRIPFNTFHYRGFHVLEEPQVAFHSSDIPLGGRCVAGYRLRLGMRFADQSDVYQYISLRRKVRLRGRRGLRRMTGVVDFGAQIVKSIISDLPSRGPDQQAPTGDPDAKDPGTDEGTDTGPSVPPPQTT